MIGENQTSQTVDICEICLSLKRDGVCDRCQAKYEEIPDSEEPSAVSDQFRSMSGHNDLGTLFI